MICRVQDFFKLCPEIAPEKRTEMSKDPKAFIAVCSTASQDTDKKCQEWLTTNREALKEVGIFWGLSESQALDTKFFNRKLSLKWTPLSFSYCRVSRHQTLNAQALNPKP